MLKLLRWILRVLAGLIQAIIGNDRTPDLFRGWAPIITEQIPPVASDGKSSAPYPIQSTDSTGLYQLILINASLPKEETRKLLPKGLTLDPAAPGEPDRHPVIYTLGYQQNVRTILNKQGINYLECIMGIPWVKLSDTTGYQAPFIYLPRLHLNHLFPCILGWLCGYPKRWSRVTATPSTLEVRSLILGRKILRAEFQAEGKVIKPADCPNFHSVGPMLDQPTVGLIGKMQLFTHLHWRLEYALIQSASIDVVLQSSNLPGLAPGHYHWNGISTDVQGACRMSVPWQFIFPFNKDILEKKPGST